MVYWRLATVMRATMKAKTPPFSANLDTRSTLLSRTAGAQNGATEDSSKWPPLDTIIAVLQPPLATHWSRDLLVTYLMFRNSKLVNRKPHFFYKLANLIAHKYNSHIFRR